MEKISAFPKSIGVLLYPQFEILDVAGPIEALNCLSKRAGFEDMELSIISKTLDPISVGPIAPDKKSLNFTGRQLYLPTHTFDTAPPLDVLIVPGGTGSIDPLPSGAKPDIDDHVDFIRKAFRGDQGFRPLQYLISICNGTILLAKAGLLDGHIATTNKDGWKSITALSPTTHWIAKARWVDSGRLWTTSGVSAGVDGVLAWMSKLLPEDLVTSVVNTMEWIRVESADNDPFASVFQCEDVLPKQTSIEL